MAVTHENGHDRWDNKPPAAGGVAYGGLGYDRARGSVTVGDKLYLHMFMG